MALLFETYQQWFGDKLMTPASFRKRMEEQGFESKRGTGGNWFYHGIGLPADGASDGR